MALRIRFGIGRFSFFDGFFFRCELVGALNCAVLIVDANLAFVFGALMVDADGYLCLLAGKPYVCLVFVVAVAASGPIRDGFSI